jgi:hypothetical protein
MSNACQIHPLYMTNYAKWPCAEVPFFTASTAVLASFCFALGSLFAAALPSFFCLCSIHLTGRVFEAAQYLPLIVEFHIVECALYDAYHG